MNCVGTQVKHGKKCNTIMLGDVINWIISRPGSIDLENCLVLTACKYIVNVRATRHVPHNGPSMKSLFILSTYLMQGTYLFTLKHISKKLFKNLDRIVLLRTRAFAIRFYLPNSMTASAATYILSKFWLE